MNKTERYDDQCYSGLICHIGISDLVFNGQEISISACTKLLYLFPVSLEKDPKNESGSKFCC